MAFRLALKPEYDVDVKVAFPVEGGRLEQHTFRARFRRVSQAEIDRLREAIENRSITDRELLDSVLVGWSGVQDADGNEIPCEGADRDRVLDVHPMQPRLVAAFLDSLASAREKN